LRGLLVKAEESQQSLRAVGHQNIRGWGGIGCWWNRWVIHITVITVEEDQKGNF